MTKQQQKQIDKLDNNLSQFTSGISGITASQLSSEEGVVKNIRYNLISLNRSMLQYVYTNFGIIQTFIDQPVDDAYSKGIEIDILDDTFDEDDISQIKNFFRENDINETIKQVRKWSRLYGGGGLILEVEGQEPSQDFDISSIKENTNISFYAADLWQLNQVKNEPHGEDLPYKQPVFDDQKPFLFYGVELNRSRVFKVLNKRAPSIIRSQLRGWGMSELERVIRELNNYFKSENVLYELLDETKITVHKLKDFNNALMGKDSTQAIVNRLKMVEQAKNYLNSVITDSENDINQMQVDFTGLANIMPEIKKGIASALRMPLTKIFGQSSAGFNAGEDDLENYNSMIESEIRNKDDNMIIWVTKIVSQKVLGRVPENIKVSFKPLRELTEEQEQNVKDKKFMRARQMLELGMWSEEEFNQYIESENLL
jgi:phage-related protein (TIGR01555 family)